MKTIKKKKLRTPLPRGICKEAVFGFEPMTNKSLKHNFTAASGLALSSQEDYKNEIIYCLKKRNKYNYFQNNYVKNKIRY